jgi:opacity protein-like surface antigen
VAQAFVGVDFMLSNNVSIGARYRYQYTGATSFEDDGGTPLGLDAFGAHSVEGVLKVRFGG